MNLKQKIAACLTALAAVMGLSVVVAPQAGAWQVPVACHFDQASFVELCADVNFEKQSDGSGVHINAWSMSMPRGCGNLGDPKVPNIEMGINHSTGPRLFTYNYSSSVCNFARYPDRMGAAEGYTTFCLTAKLNVRFKSDRAIYFCWNLYPSGNSVMAAKGSYEV